MDNGFASTEETVHVLGDSLQMHRNKVHLHGFECHGTQEYVHRQRAAMRAHRQ